MQLLLVPFTRSATLSSNHCPKHDLAVESGKARSCFGQWQSKVMLSPMGKLEYLLDATYICRLKLKTFLFRINHRMLVNISARF